MTHSFESGVWGREASGSELWIRGKFLEDFVNIEFNIIQT